MPLTILHTSDLHGRYKRALRLLESEAYDVWVDSGDFFPNKTRGDLKVEPKYQRKWFAWKGLGERIKKALNGRPALITPGNHDFVDLAQLLQKHGVAARNLNNAPVVWGGETWAGCRAVEWMAGEWNGEIHDFRACTARMMDSNPTVLVIHSPVSGVLDYSPIKGGNIGNPVLASWLAYKPHQVKLVLHGHVHEQPGVEQQMGITFVNSAETHHTVRL
jgi:Icc-related predicted phosphoesterase